MFVENEGTLKSRSQAGAISERRNFIEHFSFSLVNLQKYYDELFTHHIEAGAVENRERAAELFLRQPAKTKSGKARNATTSERAREENKTLLGAFTHRILLNIS